MEVDKNRNKSQLGSATGAERGRGAGKEKMGRRLSTGHAAVRGQGSGSSAWHSRPSFSLSSQALQTHPLLSQFPPSLLNMSEPPPEPGSLAGIPLFLPPWLPTTPSYQGAGGPGMAAGRARLQIPSGLE